MMRSCVCLIVLMISSIMVLPTGNVTAENESVEEIVETSEWVRGVTIVTPKTVTDVCIGKEQMKSYFIYGNGTVEYFNLNSDDKSPGSGVLLTLQNTKACKTLGNGNVLFIAKSSSSNNSSVYLFSGESQIDSLELDVRVLRHIVRKTNGMTIHSLSENCVMIAYPLIEPDAYSKTLSYDKGYFLNINKGILGLTSVHNVSRIAGWLDVLDSNLYLGLEYDGQPNETSIYRYSVNESCAFTYDYIGRLSHYSGFGFSTSNHQSIVTLRWHNLGKRWAAYNEWVNHWNRTSEHLTTSIVDNENWRLTSTLLFSRKAAYELRINNSNMVASVGLSGNWTIYNVDTHEIVHEIEGYRLLPENEDTFHSHWARALDSVNGWVHLFKHDSSNEITFYGLDSDGDTNLDYLDYCPELAWENQTDYDHDMKGDLCDEDIDNDGVENNLDDCPAGEIGINPDHDNDGCSDAEDADDDNDGIEDENDSCPLGLASGLDYDYDGCMDSEDSDDDNDGVLDSEDACPFSTTMEILLDHDGDGCYNHEDNDDDNDGIFDSDDDCPLGVTTGEDYDEDGCKNSGEDNDDDSDGITDLLDECPLGLMQGNDHDGDGCKDAEDADDDNDGIIDSEDACPLSVSEDGWFIDSDQDGCLDSEDADDDNDGIEDSKDGCPTIAATNDSDADGCPSEIDTDDDNDGIPDEFDSCPLLSTVNDADSDGCEDEIPEVGEETEEEVEVEQKEEVIEESDDSKSKDTRISTQLIVSMIVFSIVLLGVITAAKSSED